MLEQILQSSQDPDQLSLTVKGVLSALIPVAGAILVWTGHSVDNATLQAIVDAIGNLIIVGGTAVSMFATLWGLIRKALPKE